jgi:flagellar biogenesis protein FliO
MPSNRKWWLLPPAAALLLVLGSMAMQAPARDGAGGDAAAEPDDPAERAAVPTGRGAEPAEQRQLPAPPRPPELWQIGSTLIGVLLLGGGAIMVARRLRRGKEPTAYDAARLRQVLRLSAKQSLYVVEFDEQVFLIGECERGLSALHRAGSPAVTEDEDQVTRRALRAAAPDDDGAVPRDLVIPRPEPATRPPVRRPAVPGQPALTDYRALLQKAGKA